MGAVIAVMPFAAGGFGLLFEKLLMGLMVFTAGVLVARSWVQAPAHELHFDPKFGEFILVPENAGFDRAQCIMSLDHTQVEVSGRHLRVVDAPLNTEISIALSDAMSAQRVSETCDIPKAAA